MTAPGTLKFASLSPSVTSLSGNGSVVLGSPPSQSTNLTYSGTANDSFSGPISEALRTSAA